ncbi:hypothetical protein K3495_g3003 [Podosphaera aphanis]|nr:hypothetical protein K3495_g3003 [Podosphaera aphanis]
MEADNLSNQQILELLKSVEGKLKTSDENRHGFTSETHNLKSSSITSSRSIESYIQNANSVPHVPLAKLISLDEKKLAERYRVITDQASVKNNLNEVKKASAGPDWYDLPRTELTPEVKRDLKLLRMRDVLDPKRHYKKDQRKSEFPEFSQVGTIIEGPTEYYNGRLSNKERKQTLVEETLHSTKSMQRFKSKYAEIQAVKTSGKKAHYKKLKEMRTKKKFLR